MTRAENRKFHYVYRIDRFDGKFYIGLHSTDLMEDGYFGSGTHLSNSVRYHGKDKHSKTILAFFDTRKEAKGYEKLLITDEMRFLDKTCMNIAPGGGGGFIDEEHRIKCWQGAAKHLKDKWQDEDYRKVALARTGKQMQQRHRDGKVKYDNFTGKTHSSETKSIIGAKNSKHQTGEGNNQFGTRWVTDGIKPIKIKKEQLDEYLAKGFRQGRK